MYMYVYVYIYIYIYIHIHIYTYIHARYIIGLNPSLMFIYTELWGFKTGPVPATHAMRDLLSAPWMVKYAQNPGGSKCSPLLPPPDAHAYSHYFNIRVNIQLRTYARREHTHTYTYTHLHTQSQTQTPTHTRAHIKPQGL